MDLNEYTKIQCFNCHNDILSTSVHSPDTHQFNAVCEQCITLEYSQITLIKTTAQILQKQLLALNHNFQEQLQHFSTRQKVTDLGLQQLQIKLKQLQSQQQSISREEDEVEEQLSTFIDEYTLVCQAVDKQSNLLQEYSVSLQKVVQKQMALQSDLRGLSQKNQHLEKVSILNELYHIHFDDNAAFINYQQVSYTSCKLILEILCLLIDKYHYKGFTVNFCDNYIRTPQETIPINTDSESSTISWISFIAKETVHIWEHIKQEASILTHQNYSSFALPFNIELEPRVSIYGVSLAQGTDYKMFLKYFTHNLKLMINFDLNVDMAVASRLKCQN